MTREPAVAGAFYTDNPVHLKAEILSYLSNVSVKVNGEVKGIISPHAGYIYSGQVAAYGYKQVLGNHYDYVVVFAPCHRALFDGVSIFQGDGYKTPLGVVPIAKYEVTELIESSKLINFYPQAHLQEHSLEVQVPFLQVVLKDFKLVPVLVGNQDITQLTEVANIFNDFFQGKNVLYVASTDLSHFYDSNIAKKLDKISMEFIKKIDYKGFYSAIISKKTEACGAGPVTILLYLANLNKWSRCEILKYADSGDVSGDKLSVVGYVSAVILNEENSENLSEYEKETLHKIAYESIKSKLFNKPFNLEYERTENFKQKRGAFVTLHKNGQLRGCIGYIIPYETLDETVKKMAVAAAFDDPRFPPLSPEEFPEIDIEISALTPLKRIEDINEIEVGKHGIIIKKGYNSGVLLPQVATEYNWDRLTFLDQTCIKAGLSPGCWKEEETEIYIFSAEVF
jgi:AmmeMemoRadiSam system protein B/AmmeMemoRadiSam system protein A